MSPNVLQRSNIEFSHRVFLDRLTVDAQPLMQPGSIDTGPGDEYQYGNCYNPFDFGIGADCSGGSGIWIGAAILGGGKMFWGRLFDTQSFPGPFASWFRKTSQADLLAGSAAIKVCIHRENGGASDHMNTWIDGWLMESNGDHGTCTLNFGAIPQNSTYWTDFYVCEAPINEDIPYRQPMSYPRGLDYAGGRPSGGALAAAGVSFVCRYLTSGGPGLPSKQLLADEFVDLTHAGIGVVFNYETSATFMLTEKGAEAAVKARDYIRSLPGGPADPVVYFSCDFDEAPEQQGAINAFCASAQTILPHRVGLYGPYYCLKRAKDAGVVDYLWQTEAWSGFGNDQQAHIDSRVNIVQRNNLGYQTVSGVPTDINEAHSTDFGQCLPAGVQPGTDVPNSPPPAYVYPTGDEMVKQLWEQAFGFQATGWPHLFGLTADGIRGKFTVEAIGDIHQTIPAPKESKP